MIGNSKLKVSECLLVLLAILVGCNSAKGTYNQHEDLISRLGYDEIFVTSDFPLYREFRDSLSTDELVAFTDHPQPDIRLYAFKALIQKEYSGLEKILQNHLTDTARISYHIGGTSIRVNVGNGMVYMTQDLKYPIPYERLKRYHTTVEQYKHKEDLF